MVLLPTTIRAVPPKRREFEFAFKDKTVNERFIAERRPKRSVIADLWQARREQSRRLAKAIARNYATGAE